MPGSVLLSRENTWVEASLSKRCLRCGEEKPLTAFHRQALNSDGVRQPCADCRNDGGRKRYAENLDGHREATRRRQYKHRYGLTYEQYEALLAAAACGICGATQSARGKLCVDHDHETGRLRGFLCTECNLALGYLKDDPTLLRRALEYLGEGEI